MQKDFHFYAIGMLARHAGFKVDEAITIATASQYVDHATESFPIHFDDGRIFETTMTAHYHIHSFKPGVQRDVFMCFHFPPLGSASVSGKATFSHETKKDAPVINELLERLLFEKQNGLDPKLTSRGGMAFYLYRLGVALHTYADSWSHATFTGRHNDENDVGKLWFRKGSRWDRQYLNDWKWDVAPAIGHAECGHYPDQPFRKMKYELRDPTDGDKYKEKKRDNPKDFAGAMQSCLEWLRRFAGTETRPDTAWGNSKPAMKCIQLLIGMQEDDGDKRIAALKKSKTFKNNFGRMFSGKNDYDADRWRNEALTPGELDNTWGERSERAMLHAKAKPKFSKSDFRLFHKAARRQRVFVLDRLFW